MFEIGLTDHLEGAAEQPSQDIYAEIADLVELADELGVKYAWFAEHHVHAHRGHLPAPLLFALHLAGRTRRIHLGTAIICLNLHAPLDVAEQVAVADALSVGRMAPGFGSGSTPEEAKLFEAEETSELERHERFASALQAILDAWAPNSPTPRLLPAVRADLLRRCWVAVNSVGSARIAGELGFNVLFSHLRTPRQYRDYVAAFRGAGGVGLIAANRPVIVAEDDATAIAIAEPALRTLWRRFQIEGKIAANVPEPQSIAGLCGHPINFILGGPESVARQFKELREQVPFDVMNVEVRWTGLSHEQVGDSLRRLMHEVMPLVASRA